MADERFGRHEYELVQQQIGILARAVVELPLDRFLDAISQAEAIGPIVDPTLFIRASRGLREWKQAAEALTPFWRWTRETMERASAKSGD